jgi:phage terminase large subunit-like protein
VAVAEKTIANASSGPVRYPLASFRRFCASVGMPLEPWQVRIARGFWCEESTYLVLLPKGNAKTGLGALRAVWELLHVVKPYVIVGAASRDQGRVAFEACRDIAQHPAIEGRILVRHLELRGPGGGYLRVVESSGRRSHGPTPSLSLCDELWAHRDGGLLESMQAALPKRQGARLLIMSTSPITLDTPLGQVRARALAGESKRVGVVTTARARGLRMIEWSLAKPEEGDDDRLLRAVNPASWISTDSLLDARANLPAAAFLQLTCNVPFVSSGQAFPPGAWSACRGVPSFTDGEPIWVGVDMAGSVSDTAVVWVNASGQVGVEVIPADNAASDVLDLVDQLARRYAITELAVDPWRAAGLDVEWTQRGLTVVEYPQNDVRLVPASQRLYKAVIDRAITQPGDATMDQHVANAIMRQTRRGGRIDKPAEGVKIDSLIALTMAFDRSQHTEPETAFHGWL